MESGGAERVASQLLPALSKKYDVYLILLKNAIFYKIPKNVHIITFANIRQNFLMAVLFPLYIIKLKRLIQQKKPYKIISFLEIANFLNILSHKQSIISFRTSLSFFNKDIIDNIYIYLITLLYPRAKKIIVNSQENAIDVQNTLKIPKQNIQTIYNPISTSTSTDCTVDYSQLPKNKTVFITIGRLDTKKQMDVLIKLFALPSLKDSILLIIGDGPQKNKLIQLIKKHHLEQQVFLLGKKKDVFPYLHFAHYFIFSSSVEGFPNALIEAIACELPIITSDFKTGAREIIDTNLKYDIVMDYPYYGPNGVLLSNYDFINDFTKINFNEVHQAKERLERFDIASITKQWMDIIESD